jgi:hypothetical protein
MFRIAPLLAFLSLPAWPANVPVQEASAPAIIGRAMPGFYNGYLFSAEPSHVLTLFAPDGHELFSLPIQGHGNGNIHIMSVAIDSGGTLAVSWVDRPDAGIDIRDLSGKLVRTIDTGLFAPAHLSFGRDHSLWALGWQFDEARFDEEKHDYRILRKYSTDGKETGGYLSRSLFAAGLAPGNEEYQARRITVTADRVGVEVISGKIGNQKEWLELDLNGNILGRWKLDPSNEFPGVTFTGDNHAYVHRYKHDTKSNQTFRLNRTTSSWDLMNAPDEPLYGADGEKLVFAKYTGSMLQLRWFPQP